MARRKTTKEGATVAAGRPSALLDTRVIYCGDCLEQLRKLPEGSVDLIYIDPPESSNRNYEVFWGGRSEPRPSVSGSEHAIEDRHASTARLNRHLRLRARSVEASIICYPLLTGRTRSWL